MNKVRRRIFLTILPAALALVLASCEIRVHTELTVEEDGSGVLSSETSIDDQLMSLAEMSGEEILPDEMLTEEMLPAGGGWSIEPVTGDYTGFRVSLAFDSLDDLRAQLDSLPAAGAFEDVFGGEGMAGGSGLEDMAAAGGMLSDFSLTRDGDAFIFRSVVPDAGAAMMDEAMEDGFDLSMLEDVFDIRFTLTLPGEIVSSNADLVTGQTSVWELSLEDWGRVMEARSEVPGAGAGMIIALAVALLVLAAIVYLAVDRRRRRSAETAEEAAAEAAPSDPCCEGREPESCCGESSCCQPEPTEEPS